MRNPPSSVRKDGGKIKPAIFRFLRRLDSCFPVTVRGVLAWGVSILVSFQQVCTIDDQPSQAPEMTEIHSRQAFPTGIKSHRLRTVTCGFGKQSHDGLLYRDTIDSAQCTTSANLACDCLGSGSVALMEK